MTEPALRAAELHEAWGLACCTVESLIPWVADADKEAKRLRDYRGGRTVDRDWFCSEAAARWCAGHQAAGRCALLAEVLGKKSA